MSPRASSLSSLPELVQDIAHEFQLESERKNISLHVEVDAQAANTMGDIGLIQRVLENLVRNAIQFVPAGGEVTISITEQPGSVAVAVSDNGPGIAEEDVPRIFDRFYRALDGEEARSDSSGLGLAIVKRNPGLARQSHYGHQRARCWYFDSNFSCPTASRPPERIEACSIAGGSWTPPPKLLPVIDGAFLGNP